MNMRYLFFEKEKLYARSSFMKGRSFSGPTCLAVKKQRDIH